MTHIVWWLDGWVWRSVRCATHSIALMVAAEHAFEGRYVQIKQVAQA